MYYWNFLTLVVFRGGVVYNFFQIQPISFTNWILFMRFANNWDFFDKTKNWKYGIKSSFKWWSLNNFTSNSPLENTLTLILQIALPLFCFYLSYTMFHSQFNDISCSMFEYKLTVNVNKWKIYYVGTRKSWRMSKLYKIECANSLLSVSTSFTKMPFVFILPFTLTNMEIGILLIFSEWRENKRTPIAFTSSFFQYADNWKVKHFHAKKIKFYQIIFKTGEPNTFHTCKNWGELN